MQKKIYLLCIAPLLTFSLSCAQINIFKKKEAKKTTEVKQLPDTVKTHSEKPVKEIFHKKNEYKIALILSFYLNKFDIKETIEEEYEYVINHEEEKEIIVEEKLPTVYPGSKLALSFYKGVLIALDSLKKNKFKVKLYVYDTQNDTNIVKQILIKKELRTMDLIIGPPSNSSIKLISAFSQSNTIALISPLSPLPVSLKENPFMILSNPTTQSQCEALAGFMLDNYKYQNVFMVRESANIESQTSGYFKSRYNQLLKTKQSINTTSKNAVLPEIIYHSEKKNELFKLLSDSLRNIIFIPSTNEAFVTNILSLLNNKSANHEIVVFGLSNWSKFETVGIDLLQNLQVHIPATFHVEYDSAETIKFRKQFRDKFYTEPDEYAYHGYDDMLIYGTLMSNSSTGFFSALKDKSYAGLHNTYSFQKKGISNGLENVNVEILKFQNFGLTKIQHLKK